MATKSVATKKRGAPKSRPLTIYDAERYFDAEFTHDEEMELRRRIMDECGIPNDFQGRAWMMVTEMQTRNEICRALGSCPPDGAYIHICRQLEIDYKAFAKNEPKLPIEPFYQFVERQFPRFRPAKNKMQLEVQTHHIQGAFSEWLESACPASGCKKSEHWLWGCSDRFERVDYKAAATRIWERNAARPKLTLVHSA